MTKQAACIVGAGGGIGAAIARRFAADGWTPLLLMDRAGAADAVARETGAPAFALDLARPETIAPAFAAARARAPHLGALVLAAGVVDNGTFESAGFEFRSETWQPGRAGCCHLFITKGA